MYPTKVSEVHSRHEVSCDVAHEWFSQSVREYFLWKWTDIEMQDFFLHLNYMLSYLWCPFCCLWPCHQHYSSVDGNTGQLVTQKSQQVLDRPLWIFFAGTNDFGYFLLHRWHIEFLLIQSHISTLTGFVGTNFCSDINCSWARTSDICDFSKLCHQLWDGFAWNLEHILLPL